MNKIIATIKNMPSRGKTTIIVAIVVILVVWFILPHLSFNGSRPFSTVSARLSILVLIGLISNLKFIVDFFHRYQGKAFSMIIVYIKIAWLATAKFFSRLRLAISSYCRRQLFRFKQDRDRRHLNHLPWYLVLGSPQSGKKSILDNIGLHYVPPEQIGEEADHYINQVPGYSWKFSKDAVFISTIAQEQEQEQEQGKEQGKEKKHVAWRNFIKLLKRERRSKPLNGIILTFSFPELLLYKNRKRQIFIQDISYYIRQIHDNFKSQVPVYVIFNKLDLADGFMEFFSDLSKEELSQVWGITLPLGISSDAVAAKNFILDRYHHLIGQLRKRIMWAMDVERTSRGCELISSFPQQMQLFRRPIENFITELFEAVRYPKALQLRGVYFTSCDQSVGEPIDFLMQAMSKKFQLMPPRFERLKRREECYFVRDLFFKVMLPEAPLLGEGERRRKIKQYVYQASLVLCPVIFLSIAVGMYAGYQTNKENISRIGQHVDNYQTYIGQVKATDLLTSSLLPALDQLNAANNIYATNRGLGLDLTLTSYFISHHVKHALHQVLKDYYLPRVAAQLEQELNSNITNNNLLYAIFKAYLAFSMSDTSSSYVVRFPMNYIWQEQYKDSLKTADKLNYYLSLSLQQPVGKLPLDLSLVSRIRNKLAKVQPVQRAYGLLELQSMSEAYSDLVLSSATGGEFSSIFLTNNLKDITLPSFYTRIAYKNIFLRYYKKISNDVEHDNYAVGIADKTDKVSASQIAVAVKQMYDQNYLHAWQNALSHVQIKSYNGDINQLIVALSILTGKASPLPKLLAIINDNTGLESGNHIESYYSSLNQYSVDGLKGASWPKANKALVAIDSYLIKIQKSSTPGKAAFDAAKALVQKGGDSPIQDLVKQAAISPEPVKSWLNSIADQTWQVIISQAYQYMNTAWKAQVISKFHDNLLSRYPLNQHAISQVGMDNFSAFFAKDGVLETYFSQYIKPFVDMSAKKWKWINFNGHSIGLPISLLTIFERGHDIQVDYFLADRKTAGITVDIKPIALDNEAASAMLTVGNQKINYSHGPQFLTTLKWPLPSSQVQSQIIINGFKSGEQFNEQATGAWSLFKMLNNGGWTAGADKGSYVYEMIIGSYWVKYLVTGSVDLSVLKLKPLLGFKLPINIYLVEKDGQNSSSPLTHLLAPKIDQQKSGGVVDGY